MKKYILLVLSAAALSGNAQTIKALQANGVPVSVYTQFQTDIQNGAFNSLIAAKQATITLGTSAQYFKGDLTLATFPTSLSQFSNNLTGITFSQLVGTDITKVGTITTGTWAGSVIADAFIASSSTWNAKQNALPTGTSAQYITGNLTVGTFPTIVYPVATWTEYTTTAAQTVFVLPNIPYGDVVLFRNGIPVSKALLSLSGMNETYSGTAFTAGEVVYTLIFH